MTVDINGCPVPCAARQCIYHADIVGCVAQRWRWNIDTAGRGALPLTDDPRAANEGLI